MFKKLLVPLDRSELAEKALPYALSLAENYEAELLLLVVLQKIPTYITTGVEMGAYTYHREADELEREVELTQTYLSGLAEKYRQDKITIRTLIMKEQSIADAIVDVSKKEEIDVIVKTTHGRSGPSRWIFGNVATKVLQQAPCPVFLVRVS